MKNPLVISITFAFAMLSIACNKKSESTEQQPPSTSKPSSEARPTDSTPIPTLPYVDEWAKSSSLVDFKKRLMAALQEGNQDSVLSAFSDRIEFNPGTEKGLAGVVEIWGLDGSKEKLASLKSVFEALLNDGGCFVLNEGSEDSSFHAPSYNCLSEPQRESCGDRGCAVAKASGGQLRSRPDSASELVAPVLPFEIVSPVSDTLCEDHFKNCKWTQVTKANGEIGYIQSNFINSAADGYLKIWKESTGWKIMVLRYPGIIWDDA